MVSLKQMFKKKSKEEKEIEKFVKLKDEFKKLEEKYMKGTITNSDLERYNSISEEMKKMAKKFDIKDGKLVLKQDTKTDTKVVNPEEEMKQKLENVQPEGVPQLTPEQAQQVRQRIQQEQQRQAMIQQEQQRQAMIQQEQQRQAMMHQEQQRQAMMEQEQQRQAMMEQERRRRAIIEQQQLRAQQEAIAQQSMDEVHLFVMDLPELKVLIDKNDKQAFILQINKAIVEKSVFAFGKYNISGDKILMYTFTKNEV